MTKFQAGMRIRHCNNFDIDYHVLEVLSEHKRGVEVVLLPVHRRLQQTYKVLEAIINKKDFGNWTNINVEQILAEKNKKWLNRSYEVELIK
jgi:hypothetical protein